MFGHSLLLIFSTLLKLPKFQNSIRHFYKNIHIYKTMKITLQTVSIALDVIYTNALKPSDLQLSKKDLIKQSGVCIHTFNKLYSELVHRQLLFISGSTRAQRVEWNSTKCGMNPVLVKDIYKNLYKEEIKPAKKPVKLQYDEIINYLRSRDWTGTLSRVKESGLIKVVEEINL